eukprot:m.73044 g.73044  ORF g.73044 m.73044 type:complete len:706 (+) comp14306_c0_seq1:105-2222(+)
MVHVEAASVVATCLIDDALTIRDTSVLEHDDPHMPTIVIGPQAAGKSFVLSGLLSQVAALSATKAVFKSNNSHGHTTLGIDAVRCNGVTFVDFEGQGSARAESTTRDAKLLNAASLLATGGVLVMVANYRFKNQEAEYLQAFVELVRTNSLVDGAHFSLVVCLRNGPAGLETAVRSIDTLGSTLEFFQEVLFVEIPEVPGPSEAAAAQPSDIAPALSPAVDLIRCRLTAASSAESAARLATRLATGREVLAQLQEAWPAITDGLELPIDTFRQAILRGRVRSDVAQACTALTKALADAIPDVLECADVPHRCGKLVDEQQAWVQGRHAHVEQHIVDEELVCLHEVGAREQARLTQEREQQTKQFLDAAMTTVKKKLASEVDSVARTIRAGNVARAQDIAGQVQKARSTVEAAVQAAHNPGSTAGRQALLAGEPLREVARHADAARAKLTAERDAAVAAAKTQALQRVASINPPTAATPSSVPVAQFKAVHAWFEAQCGSGHAQALAEIDQALQARWNELHARNRDQFKQNEDRRKQAIDHRNSTRQLAAKAAAEKKAQDDALAVIRLGGQTMHGGGGCASGTFECDLSSHLTGSDIEKVQVYVHAEPITCPLVDLPMNASSTVQLHQGAGGGRKSVGGNFYFVPSTKKLVVNQWSGGDWGRGGPTLAVHSVQLHVHRTPKTPSVPSTPRETFTRGTYNTPTLTLP